MHLTSLNSWTICYDPQKQTGILQYKIIDFKILKLQKAKLWQHKISCLIILYEKKYFSTVVEIRAFLVLS